MHKGRIEAFSDGVFAIILTIMVLELKVPHAGAWTDLQALIPVFLSYVLSFLYIGIYWSNHHHLFQASRSVNGSVLWANLHLLFWLSLTPFVTAWAGENHFEQAPVALYGIILLMSAVAYYFLSRALIQLHGRDSVLAKAVGRDRKGVGSVLFYWSAIGISFYSPPLSCAIYVLVAVWWIVPDSRIEKRIEKHIDQPSA